jgi:hypothetical protein
MAKENKVDNMLWKRFHLMDVIHCIMENETRRKRTAQERENARKIHTFAN